MFTMRFFVILTVLLCAHSSYAWHTADFFQHTVRKGDTLAKLVPEHQWLLVQKVNRIDFRHLPLGENILLPRWSGLTLQDIAPPVDIVAPALIYDARGIVIYINLQYFGAYEYGRLKYWGPVSTGKNDSTPRGRFFVQWKCKDYVSRKYYSAMPFSVAYDSAGYFLHQQSLTGKPASHGCTRLLMEDAQWIFYWLRKGDLIMII